MTATKRNIFVYFLLNFITFGIYGLVVQSKMGNEINAICDDDGKHKMHYMLAWLLGLVTLGIYPLIWKKQQTDRMEDHGYRYGINIKHDGTQYLLWYLLGGIFLMGIGMIVAEVFYIVDLNQYADAQTNNPMPYVPAGLNRNELIRTWVWKKEPGSGSIKWIKGGLAGKEQSVTENDVLVIGRDQKQCNVVLSDTTETVSGKHLTVSYKGNNKYCITDFSMNGTYLKDGTRLTKGRPMHFASGTEIAICKSGGNAFILV